MSYMRGNNYIWYDGENLHIWVADGYDGWDQSGWYTGVTGKEPLDEEESDSAVKPSGVMISESVLDEFVMMRLAQMIEEGKALEAVKRAISKWSGNGGCIALNKYAAQLEAVLAKFENDMSNETQ